MEKNGGSCAGERRFHVFLTDSSSRSGRIECGPGFGVPGCGLGGGVRPLGPGPGPVRLSAVKERMWPPVLTCGLLSLLGLAGLQG